MFNVYFLETGSYSFCHPGWNAVAWSQLKQSSCLSLLSSWDLRRMPPHLVNFCLVFVQSRSHYTAQAGFELLDSSVPPASASQNAGITGMSHCAWLNAKVLMSLLKCTWHLTVPWTWCRRYQCSIEHSCLNLQKDNKNNVKKVHYCFLLYSTQNNAKY